MVRGDGLGPLCDGKNDPAHKKPGHNLRSGGGTTDPETAPYACPYQLCNRGRLPCG